MYHASRWVWCPILESEHVMSSAIERFAQFSVSLRWAHLPQAARFAAVESVIDTVGCGLAGASTAVAGGVRTAMQGPDVRGGAFLFGGGEASTATAAAYVNATAAHALELDDTDAAGLCHTGVVIIPAVLAAAEGTSASGAELLASIVVGYEVAVRVARWVNPGHRLRGFHTTATVTTIGGAAAVAHLRGLGVDETASAMGIAASFAAGTFEFLTSGSNLKRVHAGKAAASAITSCDLAQCGIEGPVTALDGRFGLYATMVAAEVEPLELDDLGQRFVIGEVGRKRHPCCRFCHAAIDAAISLHLAHPSNAEWGDIEVLASSLCCEQTGNRSPSNELQRQFSTPYGVALGLLRGSTSLPAYREAPDVEALALAERITMRVDPRLPVDSRAVTVRAIVPGSGVAEAQLDGPRGEASDPISGEELRGKFLSLVSSTMTENAAAELYDALGALPAAERLDDVYLQLRQESQEL
jgi:2-methylcitrate dehydratase PrpD